ncbi:juvenile hormone esterase-like isoform X2 [Schistocerca serialis cubense]|nr:juvenile hormone esterase-like isoform X2 [Schistocerca serialis cubense]
MEIVMRIAWVLAFLASTAAHWYDTGFPTVRLNETDIVGSWMTSYHGRIFAAFRGIPYAEPPVGDLRFRNPRPAQLPAGAFNASADGPLCVQKNVLVPNAVVMGQEDCLYLNVYTQPARSQLPVMVYLHGGAWFGGSGASVLTGPEFLMDRDIVLVTFNYRLGVLGFLSVDDEEAPGNAAMKDQVAALRWVRDHVAAFGGDPSAVTIFGQSAGAGSVHLHMLSPMSAGLFHRAISESGNSVAAWAFPTEDPAGLARRHAALVGCDVDSSNSSSSSSSQLVACLRTVDAARLVDATDQLKVWSVDPLTLYRPTVESSGDPEERFLAAAPLAILQAALSAGPASGRSSAAFTSVPWLTGVVAQEGIIRAVPILSNATQLSEVNARLDELMPVLMELPANQSQQLWQQIKRFFFPGGGDVVLGDSNAEAFIDLYSDRSFNHPLHNAVLYHRMAGHKNIFVYSFEYRGMYSYSSLFANTTKDYGVSHCDDLLYLVPAPAIFPAFPDDSPDWEVVHALVTLWTNFAKYGQPTAPVSWRRCRRSQDGCASTVDEAWWPSTTETTSLPYLQIAAATGSGRTAEDGVLKFCMRDNLLPERMAFWDSLPLQENALRGA